MVVVLLLLLLLLLLPKVVLVLLLVQPLSLLLCPFGLLVGIWPRVPDVVIDT